jgi:hypothetical protein
MKSVFVFETPLRGRTENRIEDRMPWPSVLSSPTGTSGSLKSNPTLKCGAAIVCPSGPLSLCSFATETRRHRLVRRSLLPFAHPTNCEMLKLHRVSEIHLLFDSGTIGIDGGNPQLQLVCDVSARSAASNQIQNLQFAIG